MKNLKVLEGYNNRHIDGLPSEECEIVALLKWGDDLIEAVCKWVPFDLDNYTGKKMSTSEGATFIDMPSEGYLGTIRTVGCDNVPEGLGFHAWNQNNSEFVYYKRN